VIAMNFFSLRTSRRSPVLTALALLLVALPAHAKSAGPAGVTVTEVKLERTRPARTRHETLRFLKDNRDFIRARFDSVRERLVERHGAGGPIDPRFLAYRDVVANVGLSADSLATLRNAQDRQKLLQSATELATLEVRLDRLERLLAQQRVRLGELEANYTSDPRTELIVVVSGLAKGAELSTVEIAFEHGVTASVTFSDEERRLLASGGVLQLFHGTVEPREQSIEVSAGGTSVFLTLDPERDRHTFLRLDLSGASRGGAAALRATTWQLDTHLGVAD
jgi:hypothetical protein